MKTFPITWLWFFVNFPKLLGKLLFKKKNKNSNHTDISCLWSSLKRHHAAEKKQINLRYYTIITFPLIPA